MCKFHNSENWSKTNFTSLNFHIDWLIQKRWKFIKNNFFIIKLPHAHFQYVCNITEKFKKDTPKTPGGVYFTKYALSAITNMCRGRELAKFNTV